MARSVMPRAPRLQTAAALLGLSFLQPAFAADIAVPDTGNGYSNGAALVTAINTANASAGDDTIILDPAVHYVLDHLDNTTLGRTGLPVITSGITIRGGLTSGAAVTTIRRDDSAEFFRIFLIGRFGRLTLELVQVSGGDPEGSSPPVGGGIYNDGGQLRMFRAQLSDNRANGGGGLYNSNNVTGGVTSIGDALIEETTIEDNRVFDTGGGMLNAGGRVTLDRSTISGNQGDEYGGGIVSRGTASTTPNLRLINSTVSGNRTLGLRPFKAGGIYVSSGSALIEFSTIADNAGIGIFSDLSGSIVLSNSILARNQTFSTSLGIAISADCFGPIISDGYNLVSNTGPDCSLHRRPGDRIGTPKAPIDTLLGPLAGSAGFTLTHEPMPGSIAIGGARTSRGRCPAVDQRNMSRPLHPDPCDIGSFQTARVCSGVALCNFERMVSICARHPDYCRREVIPRIEKFLPMIPKFDLVIPDCLVDGPGCWGPPYEQPKK